jgi:hypothetical protein
LQQQPLLQHWCASFLPAGHTATRLCCCLCPACLSLMCRPCSCRCILQQDCILSADPDEVLPDPRCLLITLNREPLVKLREQRQDKQRKAFLAAGQQQPAAAGVAPKQPPAVGLMLCSKEWAGLELQHAGSWQLSLVYTDEQIKSFGQVGLWRLWCVCSSYSHAVSPETDTPRAESCLWCMTLLSYYSPVVHRCGG